jgi:hypothetical protein
MRRRKAIIFFILAAAMVFVFLATNNSLRPRTVGTCSGSVPYGLAYQTTDPVFGNLVCVQNTPPPVTPRPSLINAS